MKEGKEKRDDQKILKNDNIEKERVNQRDNRGKDRDTEKVQQINFQVKCNGSRKTDQISQRIVQITMTA